MQIVEARQEVDPVQEFRARADTVLHTLSGAQQIDVGAALLVSSLELDPRVPYRVIFNNEPLEKVCNDLLATMRTPDDHTRVADPVIAGAIHTLLQTLVNTVDRAGWYGEAERIIWAGAPADATSLTLYHDDTRLTPLPPLGEWLEPLNERFTTGDLDNSSIARELLGLLGQNHELAWRYARPISAEVAAINKARDNGGSVSDSGVLERLYTEYRRKSYRLRGLEYTEADVDNGKTDGI